MFHDVDEVHSKFSTASELKCMEMQIERARSLSHGSTLYANSIILIKNQPLTRAGCRKDVHHFEFEALSTGIEYEVGDSLEVLPGQSPAAIDDFVQRFNLNPEAFITVHPREVENHPLDIQLNSSEVPIRLKTFVELTMDVASASPRQYFFEVMSFFLQRLNMKRKGFNILPHLKEEMTYISTTKRNEGLFWRY